MSKLKIVTYKNGQEKSAVRIPLSVMKLFSGPVFSKLDEQHAHIIEEAMKTEHFQGLILEAEFAEEETKFEFYIE